MELVAVGAGPGRAERLAAARAGQRAADRAQLLLGRPARRAVPARVGDRPGDGRLAARAVPGRHRDLPRLGRPFRLGHRQHADLGRRRGRGARAICAEIRARTAQPDPDDPADADPDLDRALSLDTTLDGAGVLRGDLTPECAAMVQAVLDALSIPAGAGDLRTHPQRYHDALQEAMKWLGFCVMIESWTTCKKTRRKPSSGR